MSDGYDLSKAGAGLGKVWEILNMDVKPYPCCRSVHCIIDAMFRIREQMEKEGLEISQVKEIRVATYQVGYQQCAVSRGCLEPQSGMDAKFSAPYGAAAALLFGKVTREEFEPEVVANPQLRALMEKISVEPDEELTKEYPAHWGCRVWAEFTDGKKMEVRVQDPSGSSKNPLSKKQLEDKAKSLIRAAFPGREGEIAQVLETMAEQENMPEIGR